MSSWRRRSLGGSAHLLLFLLLLFLFLPFLFLLTPPCGHPFSPLLICSSGSSVQGLRVVNIVGFRRGYNFLNELLGLAKPFGKVVKHLVLDLRAEVLCPSPTAQGFACPTPPPAPPHILQIGALPTPGLPAVPDRRRSSRHGSLLQQQCHGLCVRPPRPHQPLLHLPHHPGEALLHLLLSHQHPGEKLPRPGHHVTSVCVCVLQGGSSKVVYIGGMPTSKFSDQDILNLARPFGPIHKYFTNRLRREVRLGTPPSHSISPSSSSSPFSPWHYQSQAILIPSHP